jgi:hypothetical protein
MNRETRKVEVTSAELGAIIAMVTDLIDVNEHNAATEELKEDLQGLRQLKQKLVDVSWRLSDMTFDQALEEVKKIGSSRESFLRFWCFTELEEIRELTDRELIDNMIDGGLHYTIDKLRAHWEGTSDEENMRLLQAFKNDFERVKAHAG